MTNREAYLTLQHRISKFDHAKDINEALEVAKMALEKRTPKKPVFKNEEYVVAVDYADEHGEMKKEKYADWACPNCGWFVGQQYIPRRHNQKKCNFCSQCGQAIDWN